VQSRQQVQLSSGGGHTSGGGGHTAMGLANQPRLKSKNFQFGSEILNNIRVFNNMSLRLIFLTYIEFLCGEKP
jgi:hypothetical protein